MTARLETTLVENGKVETTDGKMRVMEASVVDIRKPDGEFFI